MGHFITIEGRDGSGKTTLATALAALIEKNGLPVLLTREPGGTQGAEAIRTLLLTPPDGIAWSVQSQALLFSAARRDHVERVIAPALAGGSWVVCDRFIDSMHVYQAGAAGRDVLEALGCDGYMPELTFLLDLPADAAVSRSKQPDMFAAAVHNEWDKTGGPDKMEEIASAKCGGAAIRQAFLRLAKANPERYAVLDARNGPEDVLVAAMAVMTERFGCSWSGGVSQLPGESQSPGGNRSSGESGR